MTTEGWPQNPQATAIDAKPRFFSVTAAETATIPLVETFTRENIEEMRRCRIFWERLPEAVKVYCEDRLAEPSDARVLSVMHVTSATERALKMEGVRATIPAEDLVSFALKIISTGSIPGDPDIGKATDRIKLLTTILNKALPDSRSIDVDERADRSDRKRRSLKDTTKAELASMSESELRDLIQKARESDEEV